MSSSDQRDQAATWAERLRARERGDIPVSRDFASAMALVAGLALLACLAKSSWGGIVAFAVEQWRWTGPSGSGGVEANGPSLLGVARPMIVFGAALFLLTFGAGWIQSGCGLFWSRLQLDFGRLAGQRVRGQISSSLIGVLRWLVMWVIVFALVWSSRDEIVAAGIAPSQQWLPTAATVVFSIAIKAIAALAALGLLDYAVQWWLYERRLAMSPDQVRQEIRADQIDPYLAQRRRTLGQSFVRDGIIRSVRASNVLLCDETGAVIGLELSAADKLPKVVLRGGAAQTEGMKQLAARFDIPIVTHSIASALFARCRLGHEVPADLIGLIRALDLCRRNG